MTSTAAIQKVKPACVSLLMEFSSTPKWWYPPSWSSDYVAGLAVGSGFFISADGLIVTAAHNVVQPYEMSGLDKRGHLLRPKRVTASVISVNGVEGDNRSFECEIIDDAGAADIGLMRIKGTEITSQPFVTFTDTRNTVPIGADCFVIGDPLAEDNLSCVKGTVRNPSYFDHSGQQVVESVFLDVMAYEGNSGSPVLNAKGECMGIFTFGDPDTPAMNGGVSASIAKPILDKMIAAWKLRSSLLNMTATGPPPSSYFDYDLPFMGISFEAYDIIQMNLMNDPSPKLQGAIVVDRPYPEVWPDVKLHDVIIQIDDVKVGCWPGQLPPTSATFLKKPGDQVTVKVRRPSPDGSDWQELTLTQTLGSYPAFERYPLSFISNKKLSGKNEDKIKQHVKISHRPKTKLCLPLRVKYV